MKLEYLIKGFPGHPLHPPLTDLTIGTYSFAAVAAVLSKLGVAEHSTAGAWWLALVVGLAATALAATTGLVEWFEISWGSPIWRTATLHMVAMLCATVFFAVATVVGHRSYVHHQLTVLPFVLTLAGYAVLTLGGWLGGKIVFVWGMRVLAAQDG